MTFADFLATIDHMKQQLEEKKIPFHKVVCFATTETGHYKNSSLELYPGFVRKTETGDYKDVHLEPGSTYVEFVVE